MLMAEVKRKREFAMSESCENVDCTDEFEQFATERGRNRAVSVTNRNANLLESSMSSTTFAGDTADLGNFQFSSPHNQLNI